MGISRSFNTLGLAEVYVDSLPVDYLVEHYWGYDVWYYSAYAGAAATYYYVKGYPNSFNTVADAEAFINTLPHPDTKITTYKLYDIWFHWNTSTSGYFYVYGYTNRFTNLKLATAFIDTLTATPPQDVIAETYKGYDIWYHEASTTVYYWYIKGYADQFTSVASARAFIETLPAPTPWLWIAIGLGATAAVLAGIFYLRRK